MVVPAQRGLRPAVSIQSPARYSHLGRSAGEHTGGRRGEDREGDGMNLAVVDKIAKAVLYEGYMLYPYRPSSVKNQQRWNFGVLCPRSYSEAQKGGEAWTMQTECLVDGSSLTGLEVRVRFLQLVARSIGELTTPLRESLRGKTPEFRFVERLAVNGGIYQPWQEAIERELCLPVLNIEALCHRSVQEAFSFSAESKLEYL